MITNTTITKDAKRITIQSRLGHHPMFRRFMKKYHFKRLELEDADDDLVELVFYTKGNPNPMVVNEFVDKTMVRTWYHLNWVAMYQWALKYPTPKNRAWMNGEKNEDEG